MEKRRISIFSIRDERVGRSQGALARVRGLAEPWDQLVLIEGTQALLLSSGSCPYTEPFRNYGPRKTRPNFAIRPFVFWSILFV